MADNERQELEELRRLEQLEGIYSETGQQVQSPTLGQRIGGRFEKMGDAIGAASRLEQSIPRTKFQVVGQALGIPGDVVGEGMGVVGRGIDQLTGGYAGQAAGYLGSQLGRLPTMTGGTMGEELPQAISQAEQWYEGLTPAQQRDFDAVANTLGFGLPFLGRGKQVVGAMRQVPAGMGAKRLPIKTAEQMRTAAGKKLTAARQGGAVFSEKFGDDFIKTVNKELKPQGPWTQSLAKGSGFDDALERLNQMKNRPMDLDDMAELDSYLGDLAYDTTDIAGNLTSEGRKFAKLQRLLRKKVDDAATKRMDYVRGGKESINLLKEGRADWARAVRMQDVERIIRKAQRTQQPATSLRTGFKNLIEADPKLRGYTMLEKSAIKKAADTGKLTDTLKTLGSRLVPIGAAVSAGPAGFVAGEALSTGARGLGAASQMARARTVQSLLSQPAATQVTPEISGALGTLGSQFFRSGVPVGAYIASEDQPVNPLQYYQLLGGNQ